MTFPEKVAVLQAYGVYALRNGISDALPYIIKAIKINPSDPINHALYAFLSENDPENAIKSLEIALGFWENETEWHMLAAEMYEKLGNTSGASRHISEALSYNPDNPKLWEKRGEINITLNQLPEAKSDFEKSIALESDDPQTWVKMAKVNRRIGNTPQAIENLQKAGQLAPDNLEIKYQEIRFLQEQNKFAEAETKANKLLQINPANTKIRVLLANSQAKQGKLDQALDTLKFNSPTSKEDPDLILEALKIKQDQEGIETLLPHLIRLADKNPEHPNVLVTLTDWLIQTNRLKKAEETAQTILRIIPEQAEVHLMLGRLQRKNGQLDQAIAHLSDAIQYDPLLVEAYIELGKTYQDRRNLEEAIKTFQLGSKANPQDARPYYFSGMALKECKNYSDAEIMLKQAKKYAPDDQNIIRQLGVVTALNLIHKLRETR